jgi:hypothetical protein
MSFGMAMSLSTRTSSDPVSAVDDAACVQAPASRTDERQAARPAAIDLARPAPPIYFLPCSRVRQRSD